MGTESLTFTWNKNINLMTCLEFLAWGSDLWLMLMGFYLPKTVQRPRQVIMVSINKPVSHCCYTKGYSYVPCCVFCHKITLKLSSCSSYSSCSIPCVPDREAACGGSVLRPVWWTTSAAAAGGVGRTSTGMNTSTHISRFGAGFWSQSCSLSSQENIMKWTSFSWLLKAQI